jgi:hypothetical protein
MSHTPSTTAAKRPQIRALAILLALLGMLAYAAINTEPASAAPKKPQLEVPVTGTSANGETVTGTYKIKRFVEKNDELFAKGTFIGTTEAAGEDTTVKKAVTIPVSLAAGAAPDGEIAAQQVSCDILNLVLGPLDLNLLGLRVQLNQVELDITAEQAPGNLLGNLLCAVAHLLDGPPDLNAIIAQLLNRILGILGSA